MLKRAQWPVAFVALCAALLAGCAKGPTRPQAPAYAFLQSAVVEGPSPTGAPREESAACVEGVRPPGVAVLLLSETSSTTCAVTTGQPALAELGDGQCTLLAGMDRCEGGHELGVVGIRAASFRVLTAQAVTAPDALDALGRTIAKSGRADVATAEGRRRGVLRPTQSVLYRPSAMVTFPDLPGRPTFARLRVSEEPEDQGPWLVIENGEPATFIGPFATSDLVAWMLDGVAYVHVRPAGCTDCGNVLDEIYAVEDGRLRRVIQSAANAN